MLSNRFSSLRLRVARKIAKILFHPLERWFDLHLTVNDYYSPIPSVKELPDGVYDQRFSLRGFELNEDRQLALLAEVLPIYADEYRPEQNGGLSLLDAYVLYALIRHRKPKRIVEIGGGDSTLISMTAVAKNRCEGHPCEFICIEPYPREFLLKLADGRFQLIQKPVQDVPVTIFDDADLIFIDSSHVAKIGSDVNHEFFEIVPRAKVGCLIHWHDIMIPTNYWRDWTHSGTHFWNESYMLYAFLQYNNSFSVCWAARYMKLFHSDRLKEFAPYLRDEHRITSFWVERIA